MITAKIGRQLIRSWLGDVTVHVDRVKQLVQLTIAGKTQVLTYDQIINYVEEFLGDGTSKPGQC